MYKNNYKNNYNNNKNNDNNNNDDERQTNIITERDQKEDNNFYCEWENHENISLLVKDKKFEERKDLKRNVKLLKIFTKVNNIRSDIILDTGSEINLIGENIAKKLN